MKLIPPLPQPSGARGRLPAPSAFAACLALVVGALSYIGCGGPTASTSAGTSDIKAYRIIGQDRMGNEKCSFDLRLEERISEADIRAIANEIKTREAEECRRTFIVYYLPGMEVGARAWATGHFNPDLEVEVLGLRMTGASDTPPKVEGDPVGRWSGDMPAGTYTIVRREGKPVGRWDFVDGSHDETNLSESKLPDGRMRFEDERGNPYGECFVIEKDGALGLYAESGRFALMERNKP